jgi:hypothetical protein
MPSVSLFTLDIYSFFFLAAWGEVGEDVFWKREGREGREEELYS